MQKATQIRKTLHHAWARLARRTATSRFGHRTTVRRSCTYGTDSQTSTVSPTALRMISSKAATRTTRRLSLRRPLCRQPVQISPCRLHRRRQARPAAPRSCRNFRRLAPPRPASGRRSSASSTRHSETSFHQSPIWRWRSILSMVAPVANLPRLRRALSRYQVRHFQQRCQAQ